MPGNGHPNGFLERIRLLADIQVGDRQCSAPFNKWKLKFSNDAKAPESKHQIHHFSLTENPFEALIPFDSDAEILNADELIEHNAWLDPNSLGMEDF